VNGILPMSSGRGAAGRARAAVVRHSTFCWVSVFAVALGFFAWRQHHEIHRVGGAVSSADPRWIILLLLVHLSVLVVAAASYRLVLRRLGHTVPLKDCVQIHLQRHVVGTITPVGGPASVYVLIRALGRRGISTNDALLTTTIRSAVGYTAFIAMLVPALALQRPSPLIAGASAALALLLGVMLLAMSYLLRRPQSPDRLSRRVPGFVRRFLQDASAHGIRARDLLAPLGLSLGQNMAGAASVYICLRALGFEAAFATALVGYAIGNLFTIIAPVFQGLGVVELTMAFALHQQGIPMTEAVAVTLLYRLGDVWFPLLLGGTSHAAGSAPVRQISSRFAPVLAGSAGAALLVVALRYVNASELLQREYSAASSQAIAGSVTLFASLWLIGMVLAARRQFAQQVVPITMFVVAVPLIALLVTSLDVSVPF
jgi:uncharacterized protein (TIRG00374 family)